MATILIVDDEPQIRILLVGLFNALKHFVLEAENSRDALQIINEHEGKIDLIVSDIMMPNMNGFELSRQAKALWPNLNFIFISGYHDLGQPEPEFILIPKPFTMEDILEKAAPIIKHSQ